MAKTPAKKAKAPARKKATRSTTAAAKKSTTAKKSTSTRARKSTGTRAKKATSTGRDAIDRTADLSDEVLKSVESGQRAAIDAVRKFVDTVDEALPAVGERPSRREKVIDAALEMADKLVGTQYEFLRSVVSSAENSLKDTGGTKKKGTTRKKAATTRKKQG